MQNVLYHTGDDELLQLLLDAPSRWIVKSGNGSFATPTLRHALCKAYNYSLQGEFNGFIVKEPNDEVIVGAEQISRFWSYLELDKGNKITAPMMPSKFINRALSY